MLHKVYNHIGRKEPCREKLYRTLLFYEHTFFQRERDSQPRSSYNLTHLLQIITFSCIYSFSNLWITNEHSRKNSLTDIQKLNLFHH